MNCENTNCWDPDGEYDLTEVLTEDDTPLRLCPHCLRKHRRFVAAESRGDHANDMRKHGDL